MLLIRKNNHMKPSWRCLLRKILLSVLPVVALVCFLLIAKTAWVGGRWHFGPFSVRDPVPRFMLGAFALAIWYLVWLKQPNKSLPWKAIAARFVLLASALAVSFAITEWTFRRHLQGSQGFGTLEMFRDYEKGREITPRSRHPVALLMTLSVNRRLIYELRSNMDMPYGDYHVTSNRDGLRESRVYEKPKPMGVKRILGIGDSGMFGWDVPQDENYLASLEHSLAKRAGSKVIEVLNGGIPGYNAQQEIEWLTTKGLAFEPDIVIVGWCGNDFDAPFFLYQPVDYMAFEGSLVYLFMFRRDRFFADTKPQDSIYTDINRADIHPEVLAGMGEVGVRRAFSRLRDLGARYGFKTLVFGPMDDLAVAICQDLELPFFNTYEQIPEDVVPAEFMVHHMHPMVEGHAVLASHLERELDRLGWLTSLN